MKKQYDFSKGERGKFYFPNAEIKYKESAPYSNLEFEKKSTLEFFEDSIKSLDFLESHDLVESELNLSIFWQIKEIANDIFKINFDEKISYVDMRNKIIDAIKNCEDIKKLINFKDCCWNIIFEKFEPLRED